MYGMRLYSFTLFSCLPDEAGSDSVLLFVLCVFLSFLRPPWRRGIRGGLVLYAINPPTSFFGHLPLQGGLVLSSYCFLKGLPQAPDAFVLTDGCPCAGRANTFCLVRRTFIFVLIQKRNKKVKLRLLHEENWRLMTKIPETRPPTSDSNSMDFYTLSSLVFLLTARGRF